MCRTIGDRRRRYSSNFENIRCYDYKIDLRWKVLLDDQSDFYELICNGTTGPCKLDNHSQVRHTFTFVYRTDKSNVGTCLLYTSRCV